MSSPICLNPNQLIIFFFHFTLFFFFLFDLHSFLHIVLGFDYGLSLVYPTVLPLEPVLKDNA